MQSPLLASLVAAVALALPLAVSAQSDESSSVQGGNMTPSAATTPSMHHGHKHHSSHSSTSRTASTHATATKGRYSTEADAQTHCGSGTVAWMNTKSHAIHLKGDKYYGNTKNGAYVCEGSR